MGCVQDVPVAPGGAPSGWPIILINLRREAERRERSLARLRELGLDCVVFEAVEGGKLDRRTIEKVYSTERNARAFKRGLSAGEIGCYLSHVEIWRRIAASATPAVVLEDDFAADDDLPDLLRDMARRGMPDAVVKLGCGPRRVTEIGPLTPHRALVDPWIVPPYTTGYVVTPKAAAALLAHAIPFARPVDTDLKHWWELGVRVLAVYPGVVRPGREAGGTSSLDAGRRATKSGSRLVRFVRNLAFQSRFLVNLIRARLHTRSMRKHAVPALRSAPHA